MNEEIFELNFIVILLLFIVGLLFLVGYGILQQLREIKQLEKEIKDKEGNL